MDTYHVSLFYSTHWLQYCCCCWYVSHNDVPLLAHGFFGRLIFIDHIIMRTEFEGTFHSLSLSVYLRKLGWLTWPIAALKCVYRASMRKKFTTGMCLLIVQYCLETNVQLYNLQPIHTIQNQFSEDL